jgi:hypothetical protein
MLPEDKKMKILALNGSPRMKASSTWIVSVDGAIAIGQEILDSFCEILVSK